MQSELELVAKLLELISSDDHERLCQGREYSCTCGYDERKDAALAEAATAIERLVAERDEARKESSDFERMHAEAVETAVEEMARADAAEAQRDKLKAALSFIASQENLFFAECSQAEEIVTRARQTLEDTP